MWLQFKLKRKGSILHVWGDICPFSVPKKLFFLIGLCCNSYPTDTGTHSGCRLPNFAERWGSGTPHPGQERREGEGGGGSWIEIERHVRLDDVENAIPMSRRACFDRRPCRPRPSPPLRACLPSVWLRVYKLARMLVMLHIAPSVVRGKVSRRLPTSKKGPGSFRLVVTLMRS